MQASPADRKSRYDVEKNVTVLHSEIKPLDPDVGKPALSEYVALAGKGCAKEELSESLQRGV